MSRVRVGDQFDAQIGRFETIEAFSKVYFELAAKHPELAKLLARMPNLDLELDGRLLRFRQAKPAAASPGAPPAKN